jgi:hypothetical protein
MFKENTDATIQELLQIKVKNIGFEVEFRSKDKNGNKKIDSTVGEEASEAIENAKILKDELIRDGHEIEAIFLSMCSLHYELPYVYPDATYFLSKKLNITSYFNSLHDNKNTINLNQKREENKTQEDLKLQNFITASHCKDNFSRDGLKALFRHFESQSCAIQENVWFRIGVGNFCCEFKEYESFEELNNQFKEELRTKSACEEFFGICLITEKGSIVVPKR